MYYSAIGILAVMILIIENQDILLSRSGTFDQPAWKVFREFLFAVLVYYISDILWGVLESFHLSGLLFADTIVYFIALAAGILFWTQYAVTYLEEENRFGSFLLISGRVIAVLVICSAVLNIFVPVLFTVDSDCVYRALPVRYVLLGAQILLLVLVSAFAISSILRKGADPENGKKYRTLALFGLTMAVFLFAQLWYPYLPLYTVAYMLGICLIRAFVIGDEKEAYRHELEETAGAKKLKEMIVSLLDHMPGMAYTKEADTGIYLICNKSFASYAHRENPEEVAGLTDKQIFDPERAARFAEDDRMTLSMDEPYIFFEDVTDDDGNQRQIQTIRLKYTDSTDRLCLMGIRQDVTDMVHIQRESATTKEAYEKARSTGIMYSHMAQSMARSYDVLYYVNVDSEEFIEYRTDEAGGPLNEVRRGFHFFEECRYLGEQRVYPDDLPSFLNAVDRKNLMAALDRNKTFFFTYRITTSRGPVYVSLSVSRMEDDERFIILGVTDIDEEMKQRQVTERMREEQIAYKRINALTGDFLCVYVVEPESGRYREFSASAGYESFRQPKDGLDFFSDVREAAETFTHPDDLSRFLAAFTRENVMTEIERRGFFTVSYRLMMEGSPIYVQLKAAMVEEKEGTRLIVGINDIDAQVRQEENYVRDLARARIDANIDALTGVKNRHAYLAAEERMDQQIAEQRSPEFAIVILDVNDLKKVNDHEGHAAGDQYLKAACKIICDTFKHSPVYRVGGDEFVVISTGNDYLSIGELIGQLDTHNENALQNGGIMIACGMAKYEEGLNVASVFERADGRMYENKCALKAKENR